MGKSRNCKVYQVALFIFLSYLITWIYAIPKALQSHGKIFSEIPLFLEFIAAFGPAIAAIAVAGLVSKRDGVMELFKRVGIWRVGIKWYIISLLAQPIIWLTAIFIYALLGGQAPDFSNTPIQDTLVRGGTFNIIIFIVVFFLQQFVSLLGEEIGWRGYLLPKLLKTKNWITSSLILGFKWALWHLPLFYIQGRAQSHIPVYWYFIDLIASTILFTWIFLNTGGSVLIATLFHTSINTSTALLPVLPIVAGDVKPFLLGLCLKLIIAAVLIIWGRENIKNKATLNTII